MSIYDVARSLAPKLIGKFKNENLLTIEEMVLVSDGMGGSTKTWQTKFTCYAPVLPLNSAEQLRAMQLNDESTHKTYIKYTDGTPNAQDRLSFRGEVYNIAGVLNLSEAYAVWVVFLKKGVVT